MLGFVSAALLGATCFYYCSARKTKETLDKMSEERVALDSEMRRAKTRIIAAKTDNAELQSALTSESKRNDTKPQVSITSLLKSQALLAMIEPDPKLYSLALKNDAALQARKYGPLFRALELTPNEADKFLTLLVKHGEALVDIVSTASKQSVPLDDSAVAALMNQENDNFTSARVALWGDAGEQQLQYFNRSLPVSGFVTELATVIALTSTPLSGAQADQLTQILANASSSYQSGGPATKETINWSTALGQAQGILSPTQLLAFQDLYVQSQVSQLQMQFIEQEVGATKRLTPQGKTGPIRVL